MVLYCYPLINLKNNGIITPSQTLNLECLDQKRTGENQIRVFVFVIFLFNFIISIIGYMSIPSHEISNMDLGSKLLLVQSMIMSFALVLLSYFVWKDGKEDD